jgi:cyclopropane fatty-acyl-phospholipid synthase-like methyltransferase
VLEEAILLEAGWYLPPQGSGDRKIFCFKDYIMPPIDPVIEKLLELRQTGSVLDVGAGDGRHALELARRGFAVTALDNDAESLEKLKKHAQAERLGITTVCADMNDYAPERLYDVVVFVAASTHLTAEQTKKLVRRLQDCTRPGGLHAFFVEMPHLEDEGRPGYAEVLPWAAWYDDWEVLMFDQVTDGYESKVPHSEVWLKNTLVRLLARKPKGKEQ